MITATSGAGQSETGWPWFLSAVLPALAAVVAALIAAIAAWRARRYEAEAQRVRDLEERVATHKYEAYQPLLDLLHDMIDPVLRASVDDKRFRSVIRTSGAWIGVYGGDHAVRAFRNFMQATYSAAPPKVLMRLYGELFLAVRKDLGDEKTAIDVVDLLGIRLRDLHAPDGDWRAAMSEPFEDLCKAEGWVAPWTRTA